MTVNGRNETTGQRVTGVTTTNDKSQRKLYVARHTPVEHLHVADDHGKEGGVERGKRQEEGDHLQRDDAVDREEQEHVDLLRGHDGLEPHHASRAGRLHRVVGDGLQEVGRVSRPLQTHPRETLTYKRKFLYGAVPSPRTAQSALHSTSLADLFNQSSPQLLLKHPATLQLMREGYSYKYPPLSIARYSFIQLSELEQCRVKILFQGSTNSHCSTGFEHGFF